MTAYFLKGHRVEKPFQIKMILTIFLLKKRQEIEIKAPDTSLYSSFSGYDMS